MKKQNNHEDNIQTESLADLPVSDEQANETKGGTPRIPGYFVLVPIF